MLKMVKVKIYKHHINSVIMADGRQFEAECFPGEILMIDNWNENMIEYCEPFGNASIPINICVPKVPVENKAPVVVDTPKENVPDIHLAISNLESAINGAFTILKALKEVQPTSVIEKKVIEPTVVRQPTRIISHASTINIKDIGLSNNHQNKEPYSQKAYEDRHAKMKKILRLNNTEDADHNFEDKTNLRPHMPKTAEINMASFVAQGEIGVAKNANVDGTDILDQTPVNLDNIVKDEKGRVDILQTLGASIG
jgi:hypothetical protein